MVLPSIDLATSCSCTHACTCARGVIRNMGRVRVRVRVSDQEYGQGSWIIRAGVGMVQDADKKENLYFRSCVYIMHQRSVCVCVCVCMCMCMYMYMRTRMC